MKKDKKEAIVSEKTPLKWPDGWDRTRIESRITRGGWKKNFREYKAALLKELSYLGATEVVISYNPSPSDRMDPGVAIYFSTAMKEDYSWQEGLGLLTPAPTLAEIDKAFRSKSQACHPDGPTPDLPRWHELTKHREQARAWVMGTHAHEHDYSIPCDKFKEVHLNLAAIRVGLHALRQLDMVGIPGMLERTFRGLKTALPAHASEVKDVRETVNA